MVINEVFFNAQAIDLGFRLFSCENINRNEVLLRIKTEL